MLKGVSILPGCALFTIIGAIPGSEFSSFLESVDLGRS
jgi:hypothetical protein